MTKMWRSLWPLFSVLILFTVVTAFGISVAAWNYFGDQSIRQHQSIDTSELDDGEHEQNELDLRRQELIDTERGNRLYLNEEQTFTFSDSKQYRLLLFDSWIVQRPGPNPYKIVVANIDYGVMISFDSGGAVKSTSIASADGRTIYRVTYWRRHPPFPGTHCYDISPDKITMIECD